MNRPMRPGPPAPAGGGTQALKAIAAIAVIVVVVGLGAWVLSKSSTPKSSSPAATRTSHATTTVPLGITTTTTPALRAPSSIRLQVLNGVGSGSYAGEWSAKLKANPGYNTQPADNATATVAASEIYVITPGYQPEARALAATVGLPASAVNATVPAPASTPIAPAERANANLVLVVGPDLAGKA